MSKTMVIELFFTKEDEKDFSLLLKSAFPAIYFIDIFPWPTPEPVLKESIDQCYEKPNSDCAIINSEILPIEDYKSKYVHKAQNLEIYRGAFMGEGLIQFLHSKSAQYEPGGLMNGGVAASFDPKKEATTHLFVKEVYNLLKKYCIKLKPFDVKSEIIVDQRLARDFYAGPHAIKEYDQVNGLYLTNNKMAYFTSK